MLTAGFLIILILLLAPFAVLPPIKSYQLAKRGDLFGAVVILLWCWPVVAAVYVVLFADRP